MKYVIDTDIIQIVLLICTQVIQYAQYFRPMPYTYLPFSAGQRACTGKHLAKLECKIMMANLFYHYHLEGHPEQNYEVATTLSCRPKYQIYVKMTNRRKPRFVFTVFMNIKP